MGKFLLAGGNYGRNRFLSIYTIAYLAFCKNPSISPNYRLQNTSRVSEVFGALNHSLHLGSCAMCYRRYYHIAPPLRQKELPSRQFFLNVSLCSEYFNTTKTDSGCPLFEIRWVLLDFMDFWLSLAKFAKFCRFDNSPCLFPFFIVFPVIFVIVAEIDVYMAQISRTNTEQE